MGEQQLRWCGESLEDKGVLQTAMLNSVFGLNPVRMLYSIVS
jgi:hypothetical protein